MENKLKCAVVGMGMLGTQHADHLDRHGSTIIEAVCDKKAEKAEMWATEHGCRWYADYAEMYRKEDLDLVVIATQDPYHKDPIIAACREGISFVISEKPLTTCLKEAIEIREEAEKYGTCIKVLFPNRFYPLDQAVRMFIQKGYAGRPQYGELRMDDSIDVPLNLWGKDSKNFASISSPAFFLLSHAVDLLHYYFSPRRIVKVYSVGRKSVIGSEVDYLDSFLTFDDGTVIRLKTEWTKRMEELVENYFQLTLEKGGVTYNKSPGFKTEQGLRIYMENSSEQCRKAAEDLKQRGILAQEEVCEGKGAARFDLPAGGQNDFDWNEGVCIYADSFMGKEGEVPLTDLNEGIRQVEVVEALLTSAKEEKEVVIPI